MLNRMKIMIAGIMAITMLVVAPFYLTLSEIRAYAMGNSIISPVESLLLLGNLNRAAINVKDFGAKGDGTPDADNIQEAINYAQSKGYREIILPKPETYYYIDKTIFLPSDIEIIGDNSLLKARNYSDIGFYPITIFQNKDVANINIKLQGLIVDGGWKNETIVDAGTFDKVNNLLKFNNVTGLIIKDCEFKGYNSNINRDYTENDAFTRWSLFACLNCNNVLFEDVKLNSSDSEGFMFYKCNNIVLERVETNNSKMTTPIHFWYCNGVKLLNSTILEDVGRKASGSTINVYSKNVLIDNCVIEGGTSIDIGNERKEVFTTMFVAENVTISNCRIKTSINAMGTNKAYQKSRNLCIIGNLIDATHYTYGIRPGNVQGGIIENNIIYGAESAIRVFGEDLKNVTIRKNSIYDVSKCINIAIKDGCIIENIIIEDNDMTAKTKELNGKRSLTENSSGVYFSSSDLTLGTEIIKDVYIRKNKITTNGSWVYMYHPKTIIKVKNLYIQDNEFKSKTKWERGIQLSGITGLIIERNVLKSANEVL